MSNWNNDITSSTISVTGISDDYNITVLSDMSADLSGGNITITGSGGTYTLTDTITISDEAFNWAFTETTPFEDGFPEWSDFQAMCKEYPGLQKTYEHLKAFYKLCNDDWQAKKEGKND